MNKDNSSLDYIRKKIEELNKKIDICNIFIKHNIRYFPDIFSIKNESYESVIFSHVTNIDYIYSILPRAPKIDIDKNKLQEIIIYNIDKPSSEVYTKFNEYINLTHFNDDFLNLIHLKGKDKDSIMIANKKYHECEINYGALIYNSLIEIRNKNIQIESKKISQEIEEETKKLIENLEYCCSYIKNLDIDKYYKSIIKELEKDLKEESKILRDISNKDISNKKEYIPQQGYYLGLLNNNQEVLVSNIEDEDKIKSLVLNKVDENNSLTPEEKNKRKALIEEYKYCDISKEINEINKIIGTISKNENRAKRAIAHIAYYALKEKKIINIHNPIPLVLSDYYKFCGVRKRKNGNYLYEEAKKFRKILENSILTKKIITNVKIDRITTKTIRTKFILHSELETIDVKTKNGIEKHFTRAIIIINPILFFNENINDIYNCYIQDTDGYNDFLKINGTTIGDKLFLYIEPLLSPRNKKIELDLATIINRLNLEKEYKKRKKEVIEHISRALEDMIKANTLIKDYEVVKGVNCQEKYILYNLRYKEKEVLENSKKIKSKTPKNRGVFYKLCQPFFHSLKS